MFKPKDSRKVILASDTQEAIDDIINRCLGGEIPLKVLQLATQAAGKAVSTYERSGSNYEPKYYIGLEVGLAAYQRMLEVGGTVDDVLMFAAEECEEDVDEVLGAKHRKFFFGKRVVAELDDHPKQKQMVKNNTIDKKALKQSSTLSRQLNQLKVFKNIDDRLTRLESEVSELTQRAEVFEVTSHIQNKRLDVLDKLAGSGYDKLQTALELDALGYSHKQIASTVEKSISTIRRWIRESKT
jgi:hypothetical protein